MSYPPVQAASITGEELMDSQEESLPLTVWILGAMMFLINLSFVMVFGLCAVYLKSVMGVASSWIGAVEGIAEGVSYAAKLFSGVISDFLRRRKIVMFVGYALMVFSRPVLAFSSSAGIIFSSIFMERLGNGIQATPRDALVSDVAPPHRKGACYGLKRSMGTAGSLCGGLIGMAVMYLTGNHYQQVFLLATIPAIIAFLILVFFVKEPKQNLQPLDHKKRHPLHFNDVPRLGEKYWFLMVIAAIFMYARVGETFLVLHAHQNFGLTETYAPLVMIVYNASYALLTYPLAHLSDRMNRYLFLVFGIVVLMVADLFLWKGTSLTMIFIGVGLWGIQMGLSQSMFATLIADIVPHDIRGTGFGFFYLISSVFSVFAGISAGIIAHLNGEAVVFFFSGCVSLVSLLLMVLFITTGCLKKTS